MKEWYLIFGTSKQGPFSIKELKRHPYFTRDTLVWKEGWAKPVPARFVFELKEAFAEEDEDDTERRSSSRGEPLAGQLTMTWHKDPYYILFWILMAAFLLSLAIYRFYL